MYERQTSAGAGAAPVPPGSGPLPRRWRLAPWRRRDAAPAGSGRWRGAGPALIPVAVLALLFLVPVGLLLALSLSDGGGSYVTLLQTSGYRQVFWNTFKVAGIVTTVTALLGWPMAWLLAVLPERWSRLLLAILVLSLWTNLLARTYAWKVLLQRTGVINRWLQSLDLIDQPLELVNNLTGVVIGMTYIMLPFMVLPLLATFRALDPALLRAAALCGASRRQALTLILLPLTLPGLAAGALMVFAMALGYFVTPALLGDASTMVLAELIAQLVQSLTRWELGSAAALVLLTVALALYALQVRLVARGAASPAALAAGR